MPEPEVRDENIPPPESATDETIVAQAGSVDATPLAADSIAGGAESTEVGLGRIGPYILRESLRPWCGGIIYRASHSQLKREVELQLLDPSASEVKRSEFLELARQIAQLNSRYVARDLLEAGLADGSAYMTRELPKGHPVSGFGPRGRARSTAELLYPNDRLAAVVGDAANAIADIQAAGLTHGFVSAQTLRWNSAGVVQLFRLGETPIDATDDCKALANVFANWVCRPEAHLRSDHWLDDLRRENPGVSKAIAKSVALCRTEAGNPKTLAETVEPLTKQQLIPTTFADRGFSLMIDAALFGLIFVVGFFALAVLLMNLGSDGFAIATGVSLLLYQPILETAFRNTPFRWVRGFRLVDSSGDPPPRRRVFARSILRLVAIVIIIAALSGIAVWLFPPAEIGPDFKLFAYVLIPLVAIFLYYTPALFRRDKLSLHDRLTGIFWAQKPPSEKPPPVIWTLPRQRLAALMDAPSSQVDQHLTVSYSDSARGASPLSPGQSVDQYDVERLLGEGGMASVYYVRDRTLGRTAALKVVRSGVADSASLGRFRREAELSAQIDHAHVAKVIGAGRMPNNVGLYLVMEYLPGRNLSEIVREGRVGVARAWNWAIQAAEGLRAADQLGIIHRDIKPSNLMLTDADAVKVTDFGLSKALSDIEEAPVPNVDDVFASNAHLTRTGALLGTPMFMSPEQVEGRPLDRRTDIYSLGLTLLNLLTGQPPYPSGNVREVLRQQVSEMPIGLTQKVAGLTPERRAVLQKMLAKKQDDRYSDYDALLRDLRRAGPRPLKYGRFARRAWAEVINYLVVYWPLLILTSYLSELLGDDKEAGQRWFVAAMQGLSLILHWMYIWGIGRHGSTLGKRIRRLKVTRVDGESVGCWRALLRYFIAYPHVPICALAAVMYLTHGISFEDFTKWNLGAMYAFYLSIAFVALMTLITQDRRAIHDLIAGTVVLELDRDQVERRPGWRWWMPW